MFSINLNAGHGQVVTMELWLPTNPKIKEVIDSFKREGRVLNENAMRYLLHHFRPQTDEIGKVKFRYAMVYHTGDLLQIDEREYLSYLEMNGVLENAYVPRMHYYRLSPPYREGKCFHVPMPAEYAARLKKFDKHPTKFITEAEALRYMADTTAYYSW